MQRLVKLTFNLRCNRPLESISIFSKLKKPSFLVIHRPYSSERRVPEIHDEDGPSEDNVVKAKPTPAASEKIPPQFKILFDKPHIKVPRSSLHPENVGRDFAPPPNDDPDTFGNLTGKDRSTVEFYEGDAGDALEDEYVSNKPVSRLPDCKYLKIMSTLLDQRRFADALDVLEVRMKEDRARPQYFHYSKLISYCGRAGYTKKAFQLYNDMKKRNLTVTPSVYTSLFNSCANDRKPGRGLPKAKHLLELMKEKGVTPTAITYHAMIKAFGRTGNITTAFSLADEMMKNKVSLDASTFSFLLQGCISQKDSGFRLAVLVFHKMLQYRIQPTIHQYNLLLRCARDCDMGDMRAMQHVLSQLGINNVVTSPRNKQLESTSDSAFPWDAGEEDLNSTPVASDMMLTENLDQMNLQPNLLASPPTLGNIVSLSEVYRPEDRFLLLGGVTGFLKEMGNWNVTPEIVTFTLMLDCLPSTCAAEENLIKVIESYGVDLDATFFNELIKRRCYRKDYDAAKAVTSLITKSGLCVDLMTCGCLSMACDTKDEAQELFQLMKNQRLRPNIEIVGAMMRRAMRRFDFRYMAMLFDVIEEEEINVSPTFLRIYDTFYNLCLSNLQRANSDPTFPDYVYRGMRKFTYNYKLQRKIFKRETEENVDWNPGLGNSATETDEEYFSEYVEKDAIKPQFSKGFKRHKVKLMDERKIGKKEHVGEDMGGIPIETLQSAKLLPPKG